MADMTPTNLNVSGFYRAKSFLSNFNTGGGNGNLERGASSPGESFAYVEQRMRTKFEFGTENVKAVWFGEIDIELGRQLRP